MGGETKCTEGQQKRRERECGGSEVKWDLCERTAAGHSHGAAETQAQPPGARRIKLGNLGIRELAEALLVRACLFPRRFEVGLQAALFLVVLALLGLPAQTKDGVGKYSNCRLPALL